MALKQTKTIQIKRTKKTIHKTDLAKELNVSVGTIVRTHPIWPPRAFILSQLTHQHLARLRIDYLASQESVMRG